MIGVNKYQVEEDKRSRSSRSTTAGCVPSSWRSCEELRAEAGPGRLSRPRWPSCPGPPPRTAAPATDGLGNNLLALAIDAARAKATVGEISDALEKVYGRHQAEIRTIAGVYRDEAGKAGNMVIRPPNSSRSSPRPTVAAPGSWWPRWARTATTAARR